MTAYLRSLALIGLSRRFSDHQGARLVAPINQPAQNILKSST
jgi:hypothetical protein